MSSVTAIVSAYYAERFIAARIDNLLAQQPQPEIGVVAQHVSIEAQVAQNAAVQLIETDGIPTIYTAWNLAAQTATGDYLVSANCDDAFYPGALAELAAALDEHPDVAVVYGDVDQIDGVTGQSRRWVRRPGDLDELLHHCFPGPMPMWRRALHLRYGWFDPYLQVAGDYEFWLRLAAAGEQFMRLDRVVGAYLRRSDSAEHRDPRLTMDETKMVRQRYNRCMEVI